jgi:hypothetical protein
MDWTQVLVIFGSNIGLFLWARSESKADYRHTDSILQGIREDIKDFHGRLCAIEERYRSK